MAAHSFSPKAVAAQAHVLVARKQGVDADELGQTINAQAISLLVFAAEHGATAGTGFTKHTRHDDGGCDFEVCLPVDKAVAGKGNIACVADEGGNGTAAKFHGTYDQFYGSDLLKVPAGSKEARLYYIKGPKEAPKDPSSWETELVYL